MNGFRLPEDGNFRNKNMEIRAFSEFDSPLPEAPESLDYRDYGFVTEVVDQGVLIIQKFDIIY